MEEKSRVIVITAHPDEAEIYTGGTSALFTEMEHPVKFVSLTGGDAGHYAQGGGLLAERRIGEAKESGRRLGVEYEVLGGHDGELLPTIEMRRQVIRVIREWNADIVIGFHPDGGGHPDNRNAGKLVRDAAALVSFLPNIVPGTPYLEKHPLYLLMPDFYSRKHYRPDLVIAFDDMLDKKLSACDAHSTQFYEFAPWARGILDQVPEGDREKKQFILKWWKEFFEVTPEMQEPLRRWYGEERAKQVTYAEPFEVADYGRQPDDNVIRTLFPMLH